MRSPTVNRCPVSQGNKIIAITGHLGFEAGFVQPALDTMCYVEG